MSKRTIPEPIKRTLRQEAKFGCCKCGNPILEYHHIIPWHNIRMHNTKDMMVLCPNCHYSIDSLSEENQRKHKSNPYNLNNDNKSGSLIISQGICAIDTGVIKLLGDGPIIVSKNKSLMEFYVNENNILEISLNLFNKDGKLILKIIKNEWVKGNIESWDIEFVSGSKSLTLREKKGEINLKINANQMPVLVEGTFWMGGNLLTFNKKGITVNNSTCLKADKNIEDKFGIYHFESGNINFENIAFKGVNYYSGCQIEIGKTSIKLMFKPTPFEWRDGNTMDVPRAEDVLIQSINTIEYFDSNITFISDFKDALKGGMTVVDKRISSVPFKKKLARFYVLTKQPQKALDIYSEIQIQQHKYYGHPNIKEGEITFEISKYLFSLNNLKTAKEIFIEAFINFQTNNNLPFRLLEFSQKLFNETDKCFCGSQKAYSLCHLALTNLNTYSTDKSVPIIITGLPKECRVALYFLKTHKTHESITNEEYIKGYELKFTKKCTGIFDYKIKTNKDIPMILHIVHYGSLPILSEFVLREAGISMNIENAT